MSLLLAKNLKAKLKTEGIGVPTLSKRAKVPRQTIANWMSGQRPQNIEHVKAIADYFSVTVDDLCFGPNLSVSRSTKIEHHMSDINAGLFEVVLRRVKS